MAHFGESRKSEIGMRNDGGMRKSEVGSRNEEEENSKTNPIFRIPHSDFRILSDLPVAALRLPDKTVALLAELGIERIGQLVALPRESLSSRFGDGLALRIDQAEGLVNEVIVAERPVEGFCAEWALEYPTHNRKAIEMIVARLIERVARRLVDCNQGVVQLECRLVCGKQPLRISVGLFEPTAMTSHLMQLMRMQLERLKLPQPVQAVNVQAITTSRLEQKQNELFAGDSRQRPRQLTALVDRLSSRLGRHAVVRPRSLDDPLPERSWRYVPLTGQSRPRRAKAATSARRPKTPASKHGRPSTLSKRQRELTAADRPLRLHRLPLPLEVMAVVPDGPPVHFTLQNRQHVITRHWGPERIETGWWRGTSVRRDYYRVETASGHRFWLFRRLDDGKWFLHGEFE
jgi:protein ImuB